MICPLAESSVGRKESEALQGEKLKAIEEEEKGREEH